MLRKDLIFHYDGPFQEAYARSLARHVRTLSEGAPEYLRNLKDPHVRLLADRLEHTLDGDDELQFAVSDVLNTDSNFPLLEFAFRINRAENGFHRRGKAADSSKEMGLQPTIVIHNKEFFRDQEGRHVFQQLEPDQQKALALQLLVAGEYFLAMDKLDEENGVEEILALARKGQKAPNFMSNLGSLYSHYAKILGISEDDSLRESIIPSEVEVGGVGLYEFMQAANAAQRDPGRIDTSFIEVFTSMYARKPMIAENAKQAIQFFLALRAIYMYEVAKEISRQGDYPAHVLWQLYMTNHKSR